MARVFEDGYLQDIPQPTGRVFEPGQLKDAPISGVVAPQKTMGEKISKAAEYLPTAGALVGGGVSMLAAPGTMGASLLGGSALAGLGAAAGKAGEQIVKRAVGEEAPETSTEAAGEIFKEGAFTAAVNAVGGKIIAGLTPSLKMAGKQILKGFARINERAAMKVFNDPGILSRGKPLTEVKKAFGEFFKNAGYEYGPKSVKAATGKLNLSDNAADDFIVDTLGRIEGLGDAAGKETTKEVVQQALAARFSVADAINRAVRSGNDNKARIFLEGKGQIDDWLETKLPGFSAIRKEYEEAKIREAFRPIFPLNKNKETSVLGIITSIGSAIGAGGALGPAAAIPVGIVSSPRIAGAAIKVGSKVINPATGAAASQVMGEAIQRLAGLDPDQIKAEYKSGKIDKQTAAEALRQYHNDKFR